MKNVLFTLMLSVFFASSLMALQAEKTDIPTGREADLNPVTFHQPPSQPPVILAEKGKVTGTIYWLAPPTRELNFIMALLPKFIQTATGVTMKVVRPVKKGVLPVIKEPALIIGDCPDAAALGLKGADLPIEGFAIRTAPNRVYIVGRQMAGKPDGTAWGVIEFLERYVGVRWYYPAQPETGISIPELPKLVVPPVFLTDQPWFAMRVNWPPTSNSSNGSGTHLMPLYYFLRYGNSYPHHLVVHSPRWGQVPELRKHPELFQLRGDGTRDYGMLCYGNPHTLDMYMKCIERKLKGEKGIGYNYIGMIGNTVTVSPSDAEVVCSCKDCRKLWDKKGGQWGSASYVVGSFVAKLAARVKKRWPQLTILYLPYLNYTRAPEGIVFPDNVEVQLCGMPGMAMYAQKSVMAADQKNIDDWVRLTHKKVQNWHYSCWPADRTKVPLQYPHAVSHFYRANRDKTVGSFINGITDHWPRQNLSLYVWMKCLWNPDFNVDACMDTFCKRMFGPAEKEMRQILQIQTSRWEGVPWPNGRISRKATFELSFPPKYRVRIEKLLAQAREKVKNDPVHAARLAYYAPALELYIKASKKFENPNALRPLRMQKVGAMPKIDGKLDDACWQRAAANTFVMAHPKQGKPHYKTTVRGVWDAHGLALAFYMQEPTPERLETRNGGIDNPNMWWDDNVEIFLDVTGKSEGAFYQFIINPKLGWFDAKQKDLSWNSKGIVRAAHIGKDNWTLEVYIPYSTFPEAVRPGSGTNTHWTGNFTRHRVADCGLKSTWKPLPGSRREYQRMNTTGASFSSNMEDFAELIFQE